jgi:hypothetical protein
LGKPVLAFFAHQSTEAEWPERFRDEKTGEAGAGARIKALKSVRLSAHVLAEDSSQLAGQLLGRLPEKARVSPHALYEWLRSLLPAARAGPDPRQARRSRKEKERLISGLRGQVSEWARSSARPWLRPLRTTLTIPGGPRTLEGHRSAPFGCGTWRSPRGCGPSTHSTMTSARSR